MILACLAQLGYSAEWRVVNAAQYGASQRRRRTFILAYCNDTVYGTKMADVDVEAFMQSNGYMSKAFPIVESGKVPQAVLDGDIVNVSDNFIFTFENAGYMQNGTVCAAKVIEQNEDPVTLGQLL